MMQFIKNKINGPVFVSNCDIIIKANYQDIYEKHLKNGYDFLTNTGMYLLEPEVLQLIPDDTYFDMTNLIQAIQDKVLKVGVFPISKKSWSDVGQWEEYEKVHRLIINN